MGHIKTIAGFPVFSVGLDEEDALGMTAISLVDFPAVEANFLAFRAQAKPQAFSILSEEQQLVLGPVIRVDYPILREDSNGMYWITFSKEIARRLAEKYLKDGNQNEVNLMHDEARFTNGVNLVQWFIKDVAKGVNPEGFEGVEDGSVFAEFHITDSKIWEEVKKGTYRGFSLEGYFNELPVMMRATPLDEVLDALDEYITDNFNTLKKMTKKEKVLSALAKLLVKCGAVTTDKGILTFEGDDLEVGLAVQMETPEGENIAVEDGEYATENGDIIVVADGVITEIKGAEAETQEATAEEATEETETLAALAEDAAEAAEEATEAAEETTEDETPDVQEQIDNIMDILARVVNKLNEMGVNLSALTEKLGEPLAEPAHEEAKKAEEFSAPGRGIEKLRAKLR